MAKFPMSIPARLMVGVFAPRKKVLGMEISGVVEVIGKDVEIFLMADPVLPFSPEALALLKKRVHYFEDIKEMQKALIEWKNENLPTRRNDEFYRKHVYRENTEELILNIINNLVYMK